MSDVTTELAMEASDKAMQIARLQEDNAKLRELVRDMVDYGEGAGSGMTEWFADRMRELGVDE